MSAFVRTLVDSVTIRNAVAVWVRRLFVDGQRIYELDTIGPLQGTTRFHVTLLSMERTIVRGEAELRRDALVRRFREAFAHHSRRGTRRFQVAFAPFHGARPGGRYA